MIWLIIRECLPGESPHLKDAASASQGTNRSGANVQSCCVGDGTKLSFGFGLFVEGLASQFCCLRLLAGLLHIPKRRGSKETAVFTGEL
jgi:hypothetical protein